MEQLWWKRICRSLPLTGCCPLQDTRGPVHGEGEAVPLHVSPLSSLSLHGTAASLARRRKIEALVPARSGSVDTKAPGAFSKAPALDGALCDPGATAARVLLDSIAHHPAACWHGGRSGAARQSGACGRLGTILG